MAAPIDLNLLRVFHTLMIERSVTRTGEAMGRTQSAVSNSLRRLRDTFDDPLFVRSPKGLVPTPKAVQLAVNVQEIIDLSDSCVEQAQEFNPATATLNITIGAPDRLSLPVFLPFLQRLREIAPGIVVQMRTTDTAYALQLIEDDVIDMALGWFGKLPPLMCGLDAFAEHLVCLSRPGHPIQSQKGAVPLDLLLSFPHVVVSSGGARRAAFDTFLTDFKLKRNIGVALNNFMMVPDLLIESDLVGVFTKRTADYFAKHYALATCPVPFEIAPIPNRLIWHKRLDADQSHRWLRQQLLSRCAE